MKLRNKGILFILSSPSGGGKTSVTNCLIKQDKNLVRSVSVTTRPPRDKEVDGIDYIFKSEKDFFVLQDNNEFLEHAKVFNNYYGTMGSYITNNLNKGKDVICCIDWQGAIQIQDKMESISIFLLPPSMHTLRERLLKRGKDKPYIINERLQIAKNEVLHYAKYNYLLINDNFSNTVDAVYSIIKAERHSVRSQPKITKFVHLLTQERIEFLD